MTKNAESVQPIKLQVEKQKTHAHHDVIRDNVEHAGLVVYIQCAGDRYNGEKLLT